MVSRIRSLGRLSPIFNRRSCFSPVQVRNLNLLECHSKSLLQNYGVNVQKFITVEDPSETTALLGRFKVDEYVIKAQVLAGGRGLGHFDNGFKSGVHITKDPKKVGPIVEKMVGHRLITKQTPKDGIQVNKVMIAESVDIKKETYFSIVMDRFFNGPVIIASPMGGTDIEAVAEKTPDLIKTYPIDIFQGVTTEMAEDISSFLGFKGSLCSKAANEIISLYKLFLEVDATQVEINPLVETADGQVISVDAKINFDDNAKFRQKSVFELDCKEDVHPLETKASENNLNYIRLDGQIGCMVNGAGLAMATMDIIKLHGGEPANFLDVGGGVNESQVKNAFEILSADPNVKSILVNVFGGIVNCATIANGIVQATRSLNMNIPLVVRLEGTNVEAARKILRESELEITYAKDLDEAATKAVKTLN